MKRVLPGIIFSLLLVGQARQVLAGTQSRELGPGAGGSNTQTATNALEFDAGIGGEAGSSTWTELPEGEGCSCGSMHFGKDKPIVTLMLIGSAVLLRWSR